MPTLATDDAHIVNPALIEGSVDGLAMDVHGPRGGAHADIDNAANADRIAGAGPHMPCSLNQGSQGRLTRIVSTPPEVTAMWLATVTLRTPARATGSARLTPVPAHCTQRHRPAAWAWFTHTPDRLCLLSVFWQPGTVQNRRDRFASAISLHPHQHVIQILPIRRGGDLAEKAGP
jgi:hypothetical protein